MVTPIKLCDPAGDVLGSIIVPEHAYESLIRSRELRIYTPPDFRFFSPDMKMPVSLNEVIIVLGRAPTRDAATLLHGSLYDFEKTDGCFFIPGYAFSMKGR